MIVRERVLVSRLIQKIDKHEEYAKQIGLSYELTTMSIRGGEKNKNAKKRKQMSSMLEMKGENEE